VNFIDYGRSFVLTSAEFNSPRFLIESRLRLIDERSGTTEDYWQCASCKSERTFAEQDLFHEDNYDFLPVFGPRYGVIFRRKVWLNPGYRRVARNDGMWGGGSPRLVEPGSVRPLASGVEVGDAVRSGIPLVARSEIADASTGLRAVIECPVKTMNVRESDAAWQVDTGPVVLPDLAGRPEPPPEGFALAFVAFNAPDSADFVVEAPTPIQREGDEVCRVHHYSERRSLPAENRLYAVE
jgi:hypothetical protein